MSEQFLCVCWSNLMTSGTLTASSGSATKDNAIAGTSYSAWTPTAGTSHTLQVDCGSAQAADSMAIYGLRLTGTQVAKCQSSSDGASWTDRGAQIEATEATGGACMIAFASSSARYWRIRISDGSSFSPTLTFIVIGPRLTTQRGMHVGWTPLAYAREVDALNLSSEGGSYLGRSVLNRGIKWHVSLDYLTPAWVASDWQPFVEYAEGGSFFLVHPAPTEGAVAVAATFAWAEGQIEMAKNATTQFMSAGIAGRGLA